MNEKINNPENEDSLFDNNYFNIEYPGQNLSKNKTFKKWYTFQLEKIKIENELQYINKKRNRKYQYFIDDDFDDPVNIISIISICKHCQCYSIHSLKSNSIFAKCFKCEKEYCVGCYVEKYSASNTKMCLKGYYKSLLLKMKFETDKSKNLEFMELFFYFFITIIIMPIYLPMISCFCYFNMHPYKPIEQEDIEIDIYLEIYKTIFPIIFSLLYFIYILSFFPILFVIALFIFLIPFLRRKFLIIYEPIKG